MKLKPALVIAVAGGTLAAMLSRQSTPPATVAPPTTPTPSPSPTPSPTPPPNTQALSLPVPFVHQLWDTPAGFDGRWACGPTSLTMILAYYGLLQPKPITLDKPTQHTNPYGWYLSNSFKRGGYTFNLSAKTPTGSAQGLYGTTLDNHPGSGWVTGPYKTRYSPAPNGRGVAAVADVFGLPTVAKTARSAKYFTSSEFKGLVLPSLKAKHPVMVGGDVNGRGHIIVVRGYQNTNAGLLWIVNDPFGYMTTGKGYSGAGVTYSLEQLAPRWLVLFGGVEADA